ncbi:hypothetical protein [Sphingobacterium hungaricum]
MRLQVALYSFLFITILGCGSDPVPPITPKPDPEPVDTIKTPVTKDSIFEKKTQSVEFSEVYVDETFDQSLFLGSLWNLKDTVGRLLIENLASKAKSFEVNVMPSSFQMDFFKGVPSYAAIRRYADTHSETSSSGPISTQNSEFSDYRQIQAYLGYSKDIQKVIELVKHKDSTTIVKSHSTLRRAFNVNLILDVDFSDYQNNYTNDDINKLKKENYNPYFVHSVNYGTHLILMAESNSPRPDLSAAIDKLLENKALSTADEQVLASSNLLAYYRGGSKNSFIQYAKGTAAIKSTMAELLIQMDRKDNRYDYPINFTLTSLETYRSLGYFAVFDAQFKIKK